MGGILGDVGPHSWQGRVLLPRAGSPHHGPHELDDCRDSFPACRQGKKPDLIRLNLVVQGKGRVWIDDVHLMRETLPTV